MYIAHHSDLVAQIVKCTSCKSYLELGIYQGETFKKVALFVKVAVGVDIVDKRIGKVGDFFLGKTDDYFSQHTDTFDVIFIDANHAFEFVKRDFGNSMNILNIHGTILIHDTDPIEKKLLDPGYCGDSYKIVNFIDSDDRYMIITLPVAVAGISIVRRKKDHRVNYV